MFSKKIATIATLSIASVLALGTVASVYAQTPAPKAPVAKDLKVLPDPAVEGTDTSAERMAPKKAMTWVIRDVFTSKSSTASYPGASTPHTSVLFASDAAVGVPGVTDPYKGDTSIDQRRSLLCVSTKAGYEKPKDLETRQAVTPGGATVQTWSKRRIVVVPNVLGSDLTSDKVANKKCATAGQLTLNDPNFRMAEFHDGIGNNAAWSFWTEGYSIRNGLDAQPQNPNIKGSSEARYWVCINDQPANPWPGASCKPQ
jgi:hypothetical protein